MSLPRGKGVLVRKARISGSLVTKCPISSRRPFPASVPGTYNRVSGGKSVSGYLVVVENDSIPRRKCLRNWYEGALWIDQSRPVSRY